MPVLYISIKYYTYLFKALTIWSLCEVGVRSCTRLVHRATVLLRVSTVVHSAQP